MDPELYKAATLGDADSLRVLIERDPNVLNSLTPQASTALHIAAKHGHEDIAKVILQSSETHLTMKNAEGETPLHIAARAGHVGMVKLLVRYAVNWPADLEPDQGPLRMRNRLGNTPLHEAVKHRHSQAALELLDADPAVGHLTNLKKETPLHIAAREGLASVVREILEHPWVATEEEMQPPQSGTGSPLHQAVLGGHINIVNMLLNERSDLIDVVDNSGNSALHYAAGKNDAKMVEVLLIATVTFAASFTMPGGFHQEYGYALLGKHAAFKAFVISNTIAMCSSIIVIFYFIWAWKDPVRFKLYQLTWGHRLTVVACLAMIITLMTSVFLVVHHDCLWLAIVVIFIGCSTPFIVWAILGKDLMFIPL